jgi:hypothetical protein
VGLDLGPDPRQVAREQPPGVLRVHVGEGLAGLVDVDHQDGDELALAPVPRVVLRGGAAHWPLLARSSMSENRLEDDPERCRRRGNAICNIARLFSPIIGDNVLSIENPPDSICWSW